MVIIKHRGQRRGEVKVRRDGGNTVHPSLCIANAVFTS